jgi:formylglycine-generating enzyme required for sulfatase activity
MSGNVAEWCWDWYHPFIPEGKITSGSTTGKGPSEGTARLVMGGGWRDIRELMAVSYRYGSRPYDRDYYIGFRVIRR